MDAQGPEIAGRFTEQAGATFTTAVDRAQGLWELYGFNVIPNGFFVDERGMLRFAKIGGFDARNPEDVRAIERLLTVPTTADLGSTPGNEHRATIGEALREAEDSARHDPTDTKKLLTLAERRIEAKQYDQARKDFEGVLEKDPKSTRALVGLATIYLDQGDRAAALSDLKRAHAIAPDNWIIRKQIWAIDHPDQFYPAINTEWQKDQIKKEKTEQTKQ